MENDILILNGDSRFKLHELEDSVVQTTVTSPPYFGLRDYTGKSGVEIGKEKNVDEYVKDLKDIFSLLLVKTKEDGTLWLNLGDTYLNGSLLGVPWRVALAMEDCGWILRSDVIWHKSNAMPSSVRNRPTTDHEYIFLFAKNKNYYYNADAIREPHVTFSDNSKMKGGRNHFGKKNGTPEKGKNSGNSNLHDSRWDQAFHPLGRNKRTVWEIPLGKFRDAHFAVFPEKLVETCLLATSEQGSIVCDPFMGSGTTGVVAKKMDRKFIGVELSTKYCQMAQARISAVNFQATLIK